MSPESTPAELPLEVASEFERKAESVLRIIKDKEDFANIVEIKDNAKGEPQVTVKTRSDISAKEAGDRALAEYKRVRKELAK